VNYNDLDAFAALWDADSVWEIGEPYVGRANGRAEIVALLRRLRQSWAFFVQLTHSGVIEFETASLAAARWSVREVARSPNGAQSYDNLGTYVDRLEAQSLALARRGSAKRRAPRPAPRCVPAVARAIRGVRLGRCLLAC
jgi:hypothetical protein